MEIKNDHVVEGLRWLLVQSKGTKIEDLLTGYLDRVQVIEDVIDDLSVALDPATATGVNLDRFGTLVGLARGSYDDTTYRALISLQVYINKCNCTEVDVFYIMTRLQEILGLDTYFELFQRDPAGLDIHGWAYEYNSHTIDAQVLALLKPAGVHFTFFYKVDPQGTGNSSLCCTSGDIIFIPLAQRTGLSLADITEFNNGGSTSYGLLSVAEEIV
jgi:hypothetical protein